MFWLISKKMQKTKQEMYRECVFFIPTFSVVSACRIFPVRTVNRYKVSQIQTEKDKKIRRFTKVRKSN